jgi:hypothetical protein
MKFDSLFSLSACFPAKNIMQRVFLNSPEFSIPKNIGDYQISQNYFRKIMRFSGLSFSFFVEINPIRKFHHAMDVNTQAPIHRFPYITQTQQHPIFRRCTLFYRPSLFLSLHIPISINHKIAMLPFFTFMFCFAIRRT